MRLCVAASRAALLKGSLSSLDPQCVRNLAELLKYVQLNTASSGLSELHVGVVVIKCMKYIAELDSVDQAR